VLKNTILKEELTNHPDLSNLTILQSWQQTNYSVTPKQAEALEALVSTEPAPTNPEYPLSICAEETGFLEELLDRWVRAIERKGQAILYGPPGTGKTYIAERLAKHLIGGGDGFAEIVQFHPA
jgi:5-methylcytosine-specific restriction protein B